MRADVIRAMRTTSTVSPFLSAETTFVVRHLAWTGDHFLPAQTATPFALNGRNSIASDSSGRLYVATNQGLGVGTPGQADAIYSFRFIRLPPAVGDNIVSSVYVDTDDTVWMGCGTMLCVLSADRIGVLDLADGVPRDRWDQILRDRYGNLWVRSETALLVRAKNSQRFVDATVASNGRLPDNTNNFGMMTLDQHGRLLIPTAKGLAWRSGSRWRWHCDPWHMGFTLHRRSTSRFRFRRLPTDPAPSRIGQGGSSGRSS